MYNYSTAYQASLSYAQQMDATDPLAPFKEQFYFPKNEDKNVIYFCGNSLGLQPKNVAVAIETELASWRELAIGGYFGGTNPWLNYQEYTRATLGNMMGAKEHEITVMNALTVNLHLLMLSFYKPTPTRFKIIMEAGAFPSDQYAVETLVKHFNLDPATAIIEITPQAGKKTIAHDAIVEAIEAAGDSLAMVLFGGINYYTGQLFDIKSITEATHKVGAIAAFDLAHVAGNVPMQLNAWNVDFAVWCSYKYLNAGPGAVGGVFVHEKHATNIDTPRLGGWWGNDEATRFKMEKGFVAKPTASGWNMSTSQVFNTVCLKASLTIFEEAGIQNLRSKSIALTGYLAFLLEQLTTLSFTLITPSDPNQRGAQLCLFFEEKGKEIYQKMKEHGIIVDYREPGVIRVAPAALYCSFKDVYKFYEILKSF
jgi:kynureninase